MRYEVNAFATISSEGPCRTATATSVTPMRLQPTKQSLPYDLILTQAFTFHRILIIGKASSLKDDETVACRVRNGVQDGVQLSTCRLLLSHPYIGLGTH